MGNPEFSEETPAAVSADAAATAVTAEETNVVAELSFAETVKRAVITSGAVLNPDDIDKIVAKVLDIPEMKNIVMEEVCNKAGMEFQTATEAPTKKLQADIEDLYKRFNEETAPAMATYQAALKAAGYPEMEIADGFPGCEVPGTVE